MVGPSTCLPVMLGSVAHMSGGMTVAINKAFPRAMFSMVSGWRSRMRLRYRASIPASLSSSSSGVNGHLGFFSMAGV